MITFLHEDLLKQKTHSIHFKQIAHFSVLHEWFVCQRGQIKKNCR